MEEKEIKLRKMQHKADIAFKITKYLIDDVIVINENSELARLIESSSESKYNVSRKYLIESFAGQEFTLSDGRKAIMDKSDAKKISQKASDKKVAQLSELKKVIENAKYSHSANKVEHKKFKAFHYYIADFIYQGERHSIYLNIGESKFDEKNHIYAITKVNENTAQRLNVVSVPEGKRIQSGVSGEAKAFSNTIIVQKNKKATSNDKKLSVSKTSTDIAVKETSFKKATA